MKLQVIPVDYNIFDGFVKINGNKPTMYAIVKTSTKKLVSFSSSQKGAEEKCDIMNWSYELGTNES
jgi:hypothetical protein